MVGFGAGEPDFDTPDHIKEAAILAIRNGETKYTPAAGTVAVRKAVAYRIKEDFGVEFDTGSIIVSSGAKACLFAAFAAVLNPGDEVLVPAPYWVSYTEQIKMLGGVPVPVFAGEDRSFKVSAAQIEAAVTGDKQKIYQAALMEPHTAAELSTDELVSLCNDLIEAHENAGFPVL